MSLVQSCPLDEGEEEKLEIPILVALGAVHTAKC